METRAWYASLKKPYGRETLQVENAHRSARKYSTSKYQIVATGARKVMDTVAFLLKRQININEMLSGKIHERGKTILVP